MREILLFAHDLIRKPVPTFRDHAPQPSAIVAAIAMAIRAKPVNSGIFWGH
jgi:hypothetical protein